MMTNEQINNMTEQEWQTWIESICPFMQDLATNFYRTVQSRTENIDKISSAYNANEWERSDKENLMNFLKMNNQTVPETPKKECVSCHHEFTVEIQDWLKYELNIKKGFLCEECNKVLERNQWIYKCKMQGFTEDAATMKFSKWKTDILPKKQQWLKDKAKKYLNDNKRKSLWVCGITGVGKTTWIEMVGVALLFSGIDTTYTTFNKLVLTGKKTPKGYMEWVMKEALIIDDFKDLDDYVMSKYIYPILEGRYERKKLTIISANVAPEDLEIHNKDDMERFQSRMKQTYETILFRITDDLRGHYERT